MKRPCPRGGVANEEKKSSDPGPPGFRRGAGRSQTGHCRAAMACLAY